MNRTCPGTSTKPTSVPDGSVVNAKPRSMVSPRAFSSGNRSGSVPVSARTSDDLPWSTCPAVATTLTHSPDCWSRAQRPADARAREVVASSAGSTVRRSQTTASSTTRATTPAVAETGERAVRIAGPRPRRRPTGSSAPAATRRRRPPRCRRPSRSATAAAIVSARARSSSTGVVAMRHNGIDVASPERYVERDLLQRGERHLVGAHRARERMARDRRRRRRPGRR